MYRGSHTRARPIDCLPETTQNILHFLHLLHLNQVPSYENISASYENISHRYKNISVSYQNNRKHPTEYPL